MPLIPSTFASPWWLPGGHLQTILPVLLPRRLRAPFAPERLELADGDFLQLGWLKGFFSRLAILSHGLEGEMAAPYIRGQAQALHRAGWDALAWTFRGCGAEPNRLARSYHSGESGDLGAVIRHAAQHYSRIGLVGFSLGGNITLKYLGEAPPHPAVAVAAAVSSPIDLAASAAALDTRPANRLYLRRFLATLIRKVEAKARHFPDVLEVTGARRIRTFQEFDDRFTAPLHGFQDAADYWRRASSRQFLPQITVPTLLLNARNDPMLTAESYPSAEAQAHPHLHLETPATGGHVGFLDLGHGRAPWHEQRVVRFLEDFR